MNRVLLLVSFVALPFASSLVACAPSETSTSRSASDPCAGQACAPSTTDGGADATPASTSADAGPAIHVSATGLAFAPVGGGARRAWSTPSTEKPADVLDVVFTEWADGCHGSVPDKGRVLALYARAVDHPGVFPIKDTVVLGGDGTSGQFSMLEWTMLDRSTWPDDVRPECGYDVMGGTRWTTGTVTITRLDDEIVEGVLDATDASGKKAHATFRVPLCLSRSPKTIGCGT